METNKQSIKKMADAIRHRGPDDEQFYIDDTISLGFRRLSIIDLANGVQPMQDADKNYVLVFNGEIYNYQELRADLQNKGFKFATDSDTEVLLHGYACYGKDILDYARGMFAFVIWDKQNKKLFGARDPFGIKPFYYYKKNGEIIFGSEIKGLICHPHFEKEFNEEILADYLGMSYTTDNRTFFKNTFKLMPGHYFEFNIENGNFSEHRYFKNVYKPVKEPDSVSEDRIENVIEDSVKAHLIADVEVGSFLSSGIDSSYILKNAAEQQEDIQSFSVGYEEEKFSELPYSTSFSKSIGVKNTALKISADDFFDCTPMVQYYMDEPLGNPSAVPLYHLTKMASEHVKVVVSGEGADEFFGGYNQYSEAVAYHGYQRLPQGLRNGIASVANRLPSIKGKRFLVRGAKPIEERYVRVDYVFREDEREKLLKRKDLNKDLYAPNRHIFDECAEKDDLHKMMYFDFMGWLPFEILLKADRMSMANSLELRVPFLDKEVLKVANSLTSDKLVNKNQTKSALRNTSKRKLSNHVAEKRKLGFPSPLAEWIRQDKYRKKIEQAFHSEFASKYFNTDYLDKLLQDHCEMKSANMQKIWSIYCLIVWYEKFFVEIK